MIKGTFKSAFGEVLFKPKKGSEGCAVPKGNRRIIDTKPEQAYSLLFNEIMRFHGNSMVFHPRRGESWGGGTLVQLHSQDDDNGLQQLSFNVSLAVPPGGKSQCYVGVKTLPILDFHFHYHLAKAIKHFFLSKVGNKRYPEESSL